MKDLATAGLGNTSTFKISLEAAKFSVSGPWLPQGWVVYSGLNGQIPSAVRRNDSHVLFGTSVELLSDEGGEGVLGYGERSILLNGVVLGLVVFRPCQHCDATVLKGSILLSDYNLSNERVELLASRKRNSKSYLALTLYSPHLGLGLGK